MKKHVQGVWLITIDLPYSQNFIVVAGRYNSSPVFCYIFSIDRGIDQYQHTLVSMISDNHYSKFLMVMMQCRDRQLYYLH